MIVKRIIGLIRHRAPRQQYYLELGSFFLRKGAERKIGDVAYMRKKVCGNPRVYYIKNLYYDFNLNKITHKLADKPIKKEVEETR